MNTSNAARRTSHFKTGTARGVFRHVAFLRAINVGGRIVKMERLRALFESLQFLNVETFIASGNVIFQSARKDEVGLQGTIEKMLEEQLGYAVGVFLRTDSEVGKIAAYEPFPAASFRTPESRLFIGFLSEKPTRETEAVLVRQAAETDEFRILGREIYWLCHVRANESKFSGPRLEKTLGMPATIRNANTVRRLAAKFVLRRDSSAAEVAD